METVPLGVYLRRIQGNYAYNLRASSLVRLEGAVEISGQNLERSSDSIVSDPRFPPLPGNGNGGNGRSQTVSLKPVKGECAIRHCITECSCCWVVLFRRQLLLWCVLLHSQEDTSGKLASHHLLQLDAGDQWFACLKLSKRSNGGSLGGAITNSSHVLQSSTSTTWL